MVPMRSASCPPGRGSDEDEGGNSRGFPVIEGGASQGREKEGAKKGDPPGVPRVPKQRSTSVTEVHSIAMEDASPTLSKSSQDLSKPSASSYDDSAALEAQKLAAMTYDQWRNEVGIKSSPLAVAKALGLVKGKHHDSTKEEGEKQQQKQEKARRAAPRTLPSDPKMNTKAAPAPIMTEGANLLDKLIEGASGGGDDAVFVTPKPMPMPAQGELVFPVPSVGQSLAMGLTLGAAAAAGGGKGGMAGRRSRARRGSVEEVKKPKQVAADQDGQRSLGIHVARKDASAVIQKELPPSKLPKKYFIYEHLPLMSQGLVSEAEVRKIQKRDKLRKGRKDKLKAAVKGMEKENQHDRIKKYAQKFRANASDSDSPRTSPGRKGGRGGASDDGEVSDDESGEDESVSFKHQVFPSSDPASRSDAIHLNATLDAMVLEIGEKYEQEKKRKAGSYKDDITGKKFRLVTAPEIDRLAEEYEAFDTVFVEAIRQSGFHCLERGVLLDRIRQWVGKLHKRMLSLLDGNAVSENFIEKHTAGHRKRREGQILNAINEGKDALFESERSWRDKAVNMQEQIDALEKELEQMRKSIEASGFSTQFDPTKGGKGGGVGGGGNKAGHGGKAGDGVRNSINVVVDALSVEEVQPPWQRAAFSPGGGGRNSLRLSSNFLSDDDGFVMEESTAVRRLSLVPEDVSGRDEDERMSDNGDIVRDRGTQTIGDEFAEESSDAKGYFDWEKIRDLIMEIGDDDLWKLFLSVMEESPWLIDRWKLEFESDDDRPPKKEEVVVQIQAPGIVRKVEEVDETESEGESEKEEEGGERDEDEDETSRELTPAAPQRELKRFEGKKMKRMVLSGRKKPIALVLRVISQLFAEKIKADHIDDRELNRRKPLGPFMIDFFNFKYGLRQLASKYTSEFLYNIRAWSKESKKVMMFTRFLHRRFGVHPADMSKKKAEKRNRYLLAKDNTAPYGEEVLDFYSFALSLLRHLFPSVVSSDDCGELTLEQSRYFFSSLLGGRYSIYDFPEDEKKRQAEVSSAIMVSGMIDDDDLPPAAATAKGGGSGLPVNLAGSYTKPIPEGGEGLEDEDEAGRKSENAGKGGGGGGGDDDDSLVVSRPKAIDPVTQRIFKTVLSRCLIELQWLGMAVTKTPTQAYITVDDALAIATTYYDAVLEDVKYSIEQKVKELLRAVGVPIAHGEKAPDEEFAHAGVQKDGPYQGTPIPAKVSMWESGSPECDAVCIIAIDPARRSLPPASLEGQLLSMITTAFSQHKSDFMTVREIGQRLWKNRPLAARILKDVDIDTVEGPFPDRLGNTPRVVMAARGLWSLRRSWDRVKQSLAGKTMLVQHTTDRVEKVFEELESMLPLTGEIMPDESKDKPHKGKAKKGGGASGSDPPPLTEKMCRLLSSQPDFEKVEEYCKRLRDSLFSLLGNKGWELRVLSIMPSAAEEFHFHVASERKRLVEEALVEWEREHSKSARSHASGDLSPTRGLKGGGGGGNPWVGRGHESDREEKEGVDADGEGEDGRDDDEEVGGPLNPFLPVPGTRARIRRRSKLLRPLVETSEERREGTAEGEGEGEVNLRLEDNDGIVGIIALHPHGFEPPAPLKEEE